MTLNNQNICKFAIYCHYMPYYFFYSRIRSIKTFLLDTLICCECTFAHAHCTHLIYTIIWYTIYGVRTPCCVCIRKMIHEKSVTRNFFFINKKNTDLMWKQGDVKCKNNCQIKIVDGKKKMTIAKCVLHLSECYSLMSVCRKVFTRLTHKLNSIWKHIAYKSNR